MFGSGAMTNSIDEVSKADVIFIIGSNTSQQHPIIGNRVVEAVEKNGAKLIIADPRSIPLTSIASIHAKLNPGSNTALINGMMNVIISEGLENKEFIKNRTEDYEEFKVSVEKYTPEKVSKITGVDADDIREMARAYANAKNATVLYAMGITQHTTGTKNVRSLANLAMLCGQIGKESSGINPLRGQNNVQGACDMAALPNCLPGYQSLTDEKVIEKFETKWGKDFGNKVGLTLTEMMEKAAHGEMKGLYIVGENPMISDPDLNHIKKALESLDFLVVQDIFLSETAQFADVVLPASSYLEKDGTFTNTERRVQRVRQAIQPVGNSKPDWIILKELIKAFGYEADYSSPADISEEINSLVPTYGGITYDRLEKGGLQWPCPDINHPGTKYLHKGQFSRGLGKFVINEYEEPFDVASEEYPFILTTGRLAQHYHTGTMTRRSWALDREIPYGKLDIHPEDAEKLGIRNNAKLKISSPKGEILCKANICDSVNPGVVFMPFHFSESPVNTLINSKNLDAVTKTPDFKVCAVSIEEVK